MRGARPQTGVTNRTADSKIVARLPCDDRTTVDSDQCNDDRVFVGMLRDLGAPPRVRPYANTSCRKGAVDARAMQHPRYVVTQLKRTLVA